MISKFTNVVAFEDGHVYIFARDSGVLKECITCVEALHSQPSISVLCVAMTVLEPNT